MNLAFRLNEATNDAILAKAEAQAEERREMKQEVSRKLQDAAKGGDFECVVSAPPWVADWLRSQGLVVEIPPYPRGGIPKLYVSWKHAQKAEGT